MAGAEPDCFGSIRGPVHVKERGSAEGRKTRPERSSRIESIDIALICARAVEEKKGTAITVLDVTQVFPMADYFVLATGANRKHIQTMADEVVKAVKRKANVIPSVEGYIQGWWVLVDCGEVIVHVMAEEARDYYDLENHWGDAANVDWAAHPSRRRGD